MGARRVGGGREGGEDLEAAAILTPGPCRRRRLPRRPRLKNKKKEEPRARASERRPLEGAPQRPPRWRGSRGFWGKCQVWALEQLNGFELAGRPKRMGQVTECLDGTTTTITFPKGCEEDELVKAMEDLQLVKNVAKGSQLPSRGQADPQVNEAVTLDPATLTSSTASPPRRGGPACQQSVGAGPAGAGPAGAGPAGAGPAGAGPAGAGPAGAGPAGAGPAGAGPAGATPPPSPHACH
ncbi:uncharacterized protein LOC141955053 [Athene noctua]|uniref:uncharacterized protein LOC141955053 n=1 Tax=Athene noctua TaxID=126797 RepID=UPI003EBEB496